MKRGSWKTTVLRRLIISFILIISPLYVLSLLLYDNSLKILRAEITSSMQSQVSSYMDNLEKEVQRIRKLELELINDRDINWMAVIPESLPIIEKVQTLLRIQKRLYALMNSSKYISDAYIMFPTEGKTVSATTIGEFDRGRFDLLRGFPLFPETVILYEGEAMYLTVPLPFTAVVEHPPLAVICIELSPGEFEAELSSMSANGEERLVLYNGSSGRIIASRYDREILEKLIPGVQPGTSADRIEINEDHYLVVSAASDYFKSVLVKYVPEQAVFKSIENFQRWYVLIILSGMIVIVIYAVYTHEYIHKPIRRLAQSFSQVKEGNFSIHIEHDHDDEFRYIYGQFNQMTAELGTLIEQVIRQKTLVQKSEMKQLQSQINPHFLYNSFFILNTMIQLGEYDSVGKFTVQLGKYFQFITRNSSDDIPLADEVEHARIYTEIQELRHSHHVQVDFALLPAPFRQIRVPRLILQPLIENAFVHGMLKKNRMERLSVSFENEGPLYRIIVENSGECLSETKLEEIRSRMNENIHGEEVNALQNIHQRLQLKFKVRSGLEIAGIEGGGLRVAIGIDISQIPSKEPTGV